MPFLSRFLFFFFFLANCHPSSAEPTLKDAFKGRFLIGAALNQSWYEETNRVKPGLVQAQFNSISPENDLKWRITEPQPGQFDFAKADRYVDFGLRNGMFIVGHTLVWHSRVPEWVFTDENGKPTDRVTLLSRMRRHILALVGRYKGRIQGWDVVNEALAADGSLRNSPWRKIIGDDYLEKAFTYAHEADPSAELYYNDYNIESGKKRAGAVKLIKALQAAGIPIAGVGMQEHVGLTSPSAPDIDEAITLFGNLGIKVSITELDVDILPKHSSLPGADVERHEKADLSLNPYPNALPPEVEAALARRYAELFRIYLKHPGTVQRVTFWGVTDGDSWLNDWPVAGRTNYPLLFDRQGNPKPCFASVVHSPTF